jgi:threonine dehydratase
VRLISLADIRRARRRIAKVALKTPLLPLKNGPRPHVFVKCENLQVAGAFKIRGAFNKIASLPRGTKGVVAHSSGNHAQAVALAARMRRLPAVVVMLDQSVPHKVALTRARGAKIIFGGRTSLAIAARAKREALARGYALVPSFDDPAVVAGQGTVGLEILEQLPELRSVVVQVGGGGLASGIATAIKSLRRNVKVFVVEPKGAPKLSVSLRRGEVVVLPKTETVADGLKTLSVCELTLAHIRKYADGLAQVTDREIMAAARHLLVHEKLVVEPSGAAGLAAIMAGKLKLPRGPAVAVLSGGNADIKAILNYR